MLNQLEAHIGAYNDLALKVQLEMFDNTFFCCDSFVKSYHSTSDSYPCKNAEMTLPKMFFNLSNIQKPDILNNSM